MLLGEEKIKSQWRSMRSKYRRTEAAISSRKGARGRLRQKKRTQPNYNRFSKWSAKEVGRREKKRKKGMGYSCDLLRLHWQERGW